MTYNHGIGGKRGCVWACEWPERPADQHTTYSEGCSACLIALTAACKIQGVAILRDIDTGRPISASQVMETWQS